MIVVHCKRAKFDVYIGRAMPGFQASPFANPFKIGVDGTRAEVIQKYEVWLREQLRNSPFLIKSLMELDGKVLGCWCAPQRCHGEVLIKIIEELKTEQKFLIF